MKKLLSMAGLAILTSPLYSQESNTDATKPSAAVAVVEALSNTFLPGVFQGVNTLLGNIQLGRQNREQLEKSKEDLEKAKTEIGVLKSKSEQLRIQSKQALEELNLYYTAESNDFSTINHFFNTINIFSTKVSSIVLLSDIIESNVSFASDESKIFVINRFKDAAREVVINFKLDETKFISDNKFLNANLVSNKRAIEAVIRRINGSGLIDTNKANMSSIEISGYFTLVKEIRNTGENKLIDLPIKVNNILNDLGSYINDYVNKSNKIQKNVANTIINLN